jgi:hypothetical protein
VAVLCIFEARTVISERESGAMKTMPIVSLALAATFSLAMAEDKKTDKSLGEKTTESLKKAGEKTKEAGRDVADAAKKTTDTVVDALLPDKDARKVDVTLTGRHINVPKNLESGKTAFIVRNADTAKHNFEIQGEGVEKKFFTDIPPEKTKVLHVRLKPGTYKVFYPGEGQEHEGTSELIVR